jgi:hypothetical protein
MTLSGYSIFSFNDYYTFSKHLFNSSNYYVRAIPPSDFGIFDITKKES